jgi:hypothetical protein
MWCLLQFITKKEAIVAKKLANIALGNFSRKVVEEYYFLYVGNGAFSHLANRTFFTFLYIGNGLGSPVFSHLANRTFY